MTKQITLKDIYEVVNRLEDKTDRRLQDVEIRLDKVEDMQSKIIGAVSIVGLFVGGAVTWVWDKVRGKG